MLDEILAYLKNYFVCDKRVGVFEITEGRLPLYDFLQQDQYFLISGSVFNNGVYCYSDDLSLKDETFNGVICSLAIPPDLLELASEIEEYIESDEAKPSAYTSESFGGYSYTKATENGAAVSWQAVFRKRLKRWKKI